MQQMLAFHTKWVCLSCVCLHMQCTVPPGSQTHCCLCLQEQQQKGRWGVAILTGLDVYGASGVVFSQQILHHTCVIPRVLHSRSADLDSGVFPVGDNTCTAESGDLMARRKQQQVERARQTTVAWQPASVSIGLQVHLIWATFDGENILE